MKIILNHTLRSIRAHKGQTIVIVLTVTVVTMLFFIALSVGDLFYNLQFGIRSRVAADTDVHMSGEIFSGERFAEFERKHGNEIEYVDKYLDMPGLISDSDAKKTDSTVVMIEATDIKVFLSRYKNKLQYLRGIDMDEDYVYPAIMISEGLSKKLGYDVGDELEIYVSTSERYEKFTVTYVFENKGFFANSVVYNVLTDISAMGDKGLYTDAYIKLKEGTDKEVFCRELANFMNDPDLEIGDAIDYDYINNIVSQNENLLSVGIIFIVAIVIFILFGSYLVLAKNRSGEIALFKAVGATPVQMFFILLSEGIVYGIIGGVIGTVAARLAMQIAVMLTIPMFKEAIEYSVWNYILSLVLGVLISVFSECIPALRLIRNSVRKTNSGVKPAKRINILYLFIPIAVIVASVLCIVILNSYIEIFTVILILAVVAFIIIGSPYLADLISGVFLLFKGTEKLASAGLKRNSEMISLSRMLGAVIAFTFIAISIVNVVIEATQPYNSRFSADYAVLTFDKNTDMKEVNDFLNGTYGVDSSRLLYHEEFDADLAGKKTNLHIYAVDSSKDLEGTLVLSEKEKEMFDNMENAAVFNYDLINRLSLKEGDDYVMRLNGSDFSFKIIAEDDSKTATDRVIYINKNNTDYDWNDSIIFIKVNDDISRGNLFNELKEKLYKKNCFILNFDDWAYATSVGIKNVSGILRFLQIIIGVVCSIGIINLTISMMISRKKEFAIYHAVGMDDKKYYRLLLSEGLGVSIIGGIIGFAFSLIINLLVPSFAALIDRHINISFPWDIFVISGLIIAINTLVYFSVGAKYKMNKVKIERNVK